MLDAWLAFVLMSVDMEEPKVIVCKHHWPDLDPGSCFGHAHLKKLHNLPLWSDVAAAAAVAGLPNKRLKCWPGINAFTPAPLPLSLNAVCLCVYHCWPSKSYIYRT